MLRAYHKYYGTRTVTVRFASVYGPRQRVNERLGWRPVIPEFTTKLLRHEAPVIDGDGRQTRDFLYVKDALAGVVQAMESEAPQTNSGDTFILGTNRETCIRDIYSAIAGLLNSNIAPQCGPPKLEDIMRMCYDYSKAKATFGFNPVWTLDDGLRETVEFLREEAYPA
jgi:nucleoside-diphosphate-sugar epimerase